MFGAFVVWFWMEWRDSHECRCGACVGDAGERVQEAVGEALKEMGR